MLLAKIMIALFLAAVAALSISSVLQFWDSMHSKLKEKDRVYIIAMIQDASLCVIAILFSVFICIFLYYLLFTNMVEISFMSFFN